MEKSKKEKKEDASAAKSRITFRYSAGGVVHKSSRNGSLWLMIRPRGTERWQFPKGGIDYKETGSEAALREVEEEGGVKAEILQKLGNQSYFYFFEGKRVFQKVTFFLMRYIKDTGVGFDKNEIEEVLFLPYENALNALTFENDKKLLEKAEKILTRSAG